VIENVWNTLKERMKMAYSFARGVQGLFCHYMYCIGSYLLRNLFEKLNTNILGEIKLSLI
jgi:nucleoid-associated protein YejK